MSYHSRNGLGGVEDRLGLAAGVAASALTNPYVPEILCRVRQIEAANAKPPKAIVPCPTTPAVFDSLGLRKFMPIARAYVYAEQRPWAYPVMAALVVGVPFLLGYLAGRSK